MLHSTQKVNLTLRLPALLAAALALAAVPLTHAQPAHNAEGGTQVVSPEVSADGRATFRLYSPNAKDATQARVH